MWVCESIKETKGVEKGRRAEGEKPELIVVACFLACDLLQRSHSLAPKQLDSVCAWLRWRRAVKKEGVWRVWGRKHKAKQAKERKKSGNSATGSGVYQTKPGRYIYAIQPKLEKATEKKGAKEGTVRRRKIKHTHTTRTKTFEKQQGLLFILKVRIRRRCILPTPGQVGKGKGHIHT